jgi:hypothetical protein
MNITVKDMILKVKKVNDTQYVREIYNLEGVLVWSGGMQYYIYENSEVMNSQKMSELIQQMKRISAWNIVTIENDFES